jgi:thiamine-monophosphate kinase
MRVGDLGERKLLRHLRDRFPRLSMIGDDAVDLPPLSCPVVTTDSFFEGSHFYRWWCDPSILGRRLVEATLSDLAAMGASPGWMLCALACPADTDLHWLEGFYEGLLSRSDNLIAGGETVSSTVLGVTLTAIGEGQDSDQLFRRSLLAPGDRLWITGRIGRALDAPALLEACGGLHGDELLPDRPTGPDSLEQLRAFLQPRAAFGAVRAIRGRGVRCAIDVSDGLFSEAAHLAAESGVDVAVDLDSVPFFSSVADRPVEAASSGEDFVLLFGASAGVSFEDVGFPCVGAASKGEGKLSVRLGGREVEPGTRGYDHFRDES